MKVKRVEVESLLEDDGELTEEQFISSFSHLVIEKRKRVLSTGTRKRIQGIIFITIPSLIFFFGLSLIYELDTIFQVTIMLIGFVVVFLIVAGLFVMLLAGIRMLGEKDE